MQGLEIVRKCQRVYLEHYTSVLGSCTKEELEAFYGREVLMADRDLVESFDHEGSNEDEILKGASSDDVAVLVVGKFKLILTFLNLYLHIRLKFPNLWHNSVFQA